jgi:tetratricopeptide (TPR) repeat protein
MKNTFRGFGVALVVLALVSGCGLNMEKHYQKMRAQLVSGHYDDASKYIDSVKQEFYSKDNRLLYYMDKGMVLSLGKRYEESNQFLEKAKATAEELWTESISANALAWVTTDNSMPYQGEDFEKVLINFVSALNYIGLGNYEAARVEARQVTEKLELYNSKYDEKSGKNVYKDDAFARWLSGKLAETEGQAGYNDAWIDYKKALAVYKNDYAARYHTATPHFLIEDALRVLGGLGSDFSDELGQVRGQFPGVTAPDTKGLGEVVLLHLSGEAPYKKDQFWTAQAGADIIRIAFPEFVPKPCRIVGVRMSEDGSTAQSEMAENITAIAIQNLNDHMARIKVKAIARAVAKYLASKGVEAAGKKQGGNAGAAMQLAALAFRAGSAIAEEADKRSWITLPGSVNVARVFLPPGDHTLQLDFFAANGAVLERGEVQAKVVAGKPTFVAYRTYR